MIRHLGPDLRDLRHLMVQRIAVPGNVVQLPTAAVTVPRIVILPLLHLIRRHERTLMTRMSGLAAWPTSLVPPPTPLGVSLVLLLRVVS
jgi:hypothetical protein